ncbi:tail protein [Ruegeria phage vB_RpoS-V16]|uniref:tail length tape measure protein n=1 Tax=Ruegeria phage vB_RpoS-V16 TaxID=2218618 RepID=UPI000DCAA916|nr:tail length tape measure protein [Ruegeria phage vB_RpoS-V16]AWY09487.1 tail protein [Ruegeria phage vB_RpoS-V16]
MASRNVDLLIRARDNASRAFKSVSEALAELDGIQEGVASGAKKMDAALGQSDTAAKRVAQTIGKDVAAGIGQAEKVFERIEATVASATQQFERQKSELTEARAAYTALGKQAESAARAIKNAEDKIGPQTQEQAERLQIMRKAYSDLTREIDRTNPKLAKQESQLEQNARELDRVRGAAVAATAAMREVGRASSVAVGVDSRQAQTQTANESARRGIGQLANAERALQIEITAREQAAAEAAEVQRRNNEQIEASVRDLVAAEERLSAIQARRAAIEQARGANSNARAGLAGITAALDARARAEDLSAKAAEASRRATDALAASYERQRAAARVSAGDQAKLAQSFRQAFTQAQQMRGPIRSLVGELSRLGPEADGAANGVRRLTGQMTNGRRVFAAFYGDSRRALSLMQRIRGEVLSLTASFVGFYGVFNVGRGILESFQELEAAQNRLGAAFEQDYARVNAELARLNGEASRLGISFDTLAGNFSKFLISGQQAGLEYEQLATIFRQVSEAGRVLKLSNDQIDGTFTALTQIAGKGTLQMEELRQQLGDRLPGAVGLLANALGYGEDELASFYKAVENGQIGAEEALVALGRGLEETYGGQLEDALDSVTARIGNLQNLLFERQLTAANSGFIAGLETALDALNEWLASDEGIKFFEALGAAFGRLFELLPVVLDNMDTLVTLFQAFVAIKVAQVVAGLAGNFTNLTRITVGNLRVQVALNRAIAAYSPAAAAALRSTTILGAGLRGLRAITAGLLITFRAAFASIGGIVGIAAAALSFFAFDAIASTDSAMQDLNRTMDDADKTIGQVAQAFRDAGGDAELFQSKLREISQLDRELDLKKLREGLEAATNGNRSAVSKVIKEVRALETAINDSVSDPQARAQFLRLTYLFDQGEISAGQLREGIEDLSRQFDEIANTEGLNTFVDWLDTLAEAEDKIARLEAELAVLQGTASEAQKELLGLSEGTDEATKAAKAAQVQMSAFEEAARKLGENIPSINAKLKEFDAIQKIEADFKAALEAANAFADGAERAAAIGAAVDLRNQAYRGFYDSTVRQFDGTDGAQVAAQVLREFEKFRGEAYPDYTIRGGQRVNSGYRVGYGSGTVTRDGGLVEQVTSETRVTVAEANRDLLRRINTEFIPRVVQVAGQDRFNSFNAQQQAALISIAYNYGEIPGRIAEAVRSGTTEEIADAIRGLAGDNGGINRSRRSREAALFSTDAGVENQVREFERSQEQERRDAEALEERRREFREGLSEEIAQTEFLNSLEGKRLIDAEVLKALREAEQEAKKLGIELTGEERAEIERVTRAKYAQKQADEDRNALLEKARALEEDANRLNERRRFLIEQITQLEGQGRLTEAAGLTEELNEVEAQLDEAIAKAQAFWASMGDAEGAEQAAMQLQRLRSELEAVESKAVTTGRQINDMIADRLGGAFSEFAQKVAEGENAWDAFKNAFLRAAAEILIQIGQMIVRQAIFNALSGGIGGGNGGFGGFLAKGINGIFAHSGGVAGTSTVPSARSLHPGLFANAVRYHSGGIAGLAPDEIPAVLKRNEEVLTENDPRHRFNGGASGGQGGARPFTIVNTFDAEEVVQRGLSDDTFINKVRANRTQIKAALG